MSTVFPMTITVNGGRHEVLASSEDTLLDVLRRELRLFSCRETCGIGMCGACTVLVDGKAVSSCLQLAIARPDAEVVTAEGLVAEGNLHPVQQAFAEEQAFQCSFCTPGFVMSVVGLTREASEHRDVDQTLSGHLCRCTSYTQIKAAVERVLNTAGAAGEV